MTKPADPVDAYPDAMPADPWNVDRLDLEAYLARIGMPAAPPTRSLLDEIHEAHVRTFTFDNIDVLLEQHAGVSLDTVQEKFVGRGRGGYCFEHSTLLAAALERLGFVVRRQLARVGDPMLAGRTHLVVLVALDGEWLLCDPGFGLSLLRAIPLGHGSEDDYLGWRYRVSKADTSWQLSRWRDGDEHWELMHTTDELPVVPADVVLGHHYTSMFPTSHFRSGLMVTKHLPGCHVAVSHDTLTIRRGGEPTEHRPLGDGELAERLRVLEVPLTADEEARLIARVAALPR